MSESTTTSSISIPTWFATGGGICALVGLSMAFRRWQSVPIDQIMTSRLFQQELQTLRQSIQHDLEKHVLLAKSQVATSWQVQERERHQQLSGHYQAMQDKLKPLDFARQELVAMSTKITQLENIFLNPKRRGTFGELQLEDIIRDVFPAGSYDFQFTLSNGKRPDCVLHLPPPIGALCIDSKFPLEAFLEAEASKADGASRDQHKVHRQKVQDSLKKHIKNISERYILPGETADCAILFLPSEYLFSAILTDYYPHVLLDAANRQRVWLACPTTLLAVLTTLRGVVRGMRSDETMREVSELTRDVERLLLRMEKAERSVDAARESLRLMHVSIEKIQRRKARLDAMGIMEKDPFKNYTITEEDDQSAIVVDTLNLEQNLETTDIKEESTP
jgi:DNA recombination protein RmuC